MTFWYDYYNITYISMPSFLLCRHKAIHTTARAHDKDFSIQNETYPQQFSVHSSFFTNFNS